MFGKQKIMRLCQGSFTHSLLILFLCVGLLPLITVSVFEYFDAKEVLTDGHYRQLSTINVMLGQEIETNYNTVFDHLAANADDAKRFIQQLKTKQQTSGQTLQQYLLTSDFQQQRMEHSNAFHKLLKYYHYTQLLLTDNTGVVLFSADTPHLTGKSLLLKNTTLTKALNQAFLQKRWQFFVENSAFFSDTTVSEQQNLKQKKTHFFVLPILDEQQNPVGALITGTDEHPFFKTDNELGKYIVSYLMDEHLNLRFIMPEKTAVSAEAVTGSEEVFVDNPLVRGWLDNQQRYINNETIVQYKNSHKVAVLGVAQSLNISGIPMLLITEIPEDKVFFKIKKFKSYVVTLLLSMVLVAIFVSIFFAFYISRPIKQLISQMRQVMQGQYVHTEPLLYKNEIGELSRTFTTMTLRLKKVSEENNHQLWRQQGLIELNDVLRSETTLQVLAQKSVGWICDYFDVIAGEIWFCKTALSYGTEQQLLAKTVRKTACLSSCQYNTQFSLIFQRQVVGKLILSNNKAFTLSQQALTKLISDPLTISLCSVRVYQQLQQASEYKSDFLATMSHELRSPLHSILMLSQVLEENRTGNLNLEQQESAMTIYRVGHQLLHMVNDILDLSRVEAGQLEIIKETFSLQNILKTLTVQFDLQAKEKSLRFFVINKANCHTLCTDSHRLLQILQNLLSNAVKFTDKGGVTLTIDNHAADQLTFSVTDTGIGIPEEKQALIFQAFHQVDSSDSRRYGGTGLGLTISQKLTTLLGGTLGIHSKQDEGSTFTLTIPYVQTAEKQISQQAGQLNTFTLATHSNSNKLITDTTVHTQYKEQIKGISVMLVIQDLRQAFYLSSLLEPLNIHVKLVNHKAVLKDKLIAEPETEIICIEEELLHFTDAIINEASFKKTSVILLSTYSNKRAKTFPISIHKIVAVPCTLNELLNAITNSLRKDSSAETKE